MNCRAYYLSNVCLLFYAKRHAFSSGSAGETFNGDNLAAAASVPNIDNQTVTYCVSNLISPYTGKPKTAFISFFLCK